ncbi:hypothetical protein KCN56_14180 [Photobacterium galatheae]|uniref:hypothetical protein n=1 Tax=Photobacterium galatheae TaxID=1654360 RepID=UPI003D783528|nr:hypothetical protein [Photobacterium galatheae]
MTSLPLVSVFKAVKNGDVWLLSILEGLMHQVMSEISGRLEWAYISMNARKEA